jgi:hypothetical protein
MNRFALIAVLIACTSSSSKLQPGDQCGATDQCETGLSCLELGESLGTVCDVIGSACTITCGSNADCSQLGSSFTCFSSCGSAMVCGATDVNEPG